MQDGDASTPRFKLWIANIIGLAFVGVGSAANQLADRDGGAAFVIGRVTGALMAAVAFPLLVGTVVWLVSKKSATALNVTVSIMIFVMLLGLLGQLALRGGFDVDRIDAAMLEYKDDLAGVENAADFDAMHAAGKERLEAIVADEPRMRQLVDRLIAWIDVQHAAQRSLMVAESAVLTPTLLDAALLESEADVDTRLDALRGYREEIAAAQRFWDEEAGAYGDDASRIDDRRARQYYINFHRGGLEAGRSGRDLNRAREDYAAAAVAMLEFLGSKLGSWISDEGGITFLGDGAIEDEAEYENHAGRLDEAVLVIQKEFERIAAGQ